LGNISETATLVEKIVSVTIQLIMMQPAQKQAGDRLILAIAVG